MPYIVTVSPLAPRHGHLQFDPPLADQTEDLPWERRMRVELEVDDDETLWSVLKRAMREIDPKPRMLRGSGQYEEITSEGLPRFIPAPAHASDIDAVLLGMKGDSAVRSCWRKLERRVHAAGRQWIGAIVQRMVAPGGTDLLGEAVAVPDLGPVLAVGFGGRQAGLGRGAACRLLPATDAEADELILRFALLLREVPEVIEADLTRSGA